MSDSKKNINFIIPEGWHSLTDIQLRFVYTLLAAEYSAEEIKLLCLFRWSKSVVIGKQENGNYLVKNNKDIVEISSVQLAEILPLLDWLTSIPYPPVCINSIRGRKALPADFSEVPFESFIICDNLYQGYLQTNNENLLLDMASVLYGKRLILTKAERISVFYWFASLKEYFSRRYPDFFQPVDAANGGNLLGATPQSVENAMNAQIRALTKGDVTKEKEVLALDTHRALTELNAQAREYKELNDKLKK